MFAKLWRFLIPAIAVLIAVASVINSWGTSRANRLVEEGNAASESADALVVQHGPEFQKLFSDSNLEGYPTNREKYQDSARATAESFETAAGLYRVAADKLEEASRQPVAKSNAAYFVAKAQAFRKLADSKVAFGTATKLLLDETIPDVGALTLKVEPLITQAEALNAETDKFNAEAQRVVDEHKDEFQ
jgi:hypothetical protein